MEAGTEECAAARGDPPIRSLSLAYASAHFGKSIFWYGSESLFAFLLTEVAQLRPVSVGWVLCLSFLFSAALDLAVGVLLKRRLSTALAAAHLQLVGAFATSVALIFLFSVPAIKPESPLAISAAAVVLFRMAYAFIDIPQNAMLSSAVGNIGDRAFLASARLAGSGLAALTVAATVALLVYSEASSRAPLLVAVGFIMAFLTICACLMLYVAVRQRSSTRVESSTISNAISPAASGRALHAAAWVLIAAMFTTSFASPVFTKLLPYYAAVHLLDPVRGTVAISMVSVGMVLGQPIWLRVLKHRSGPAKIVVTCLATSVTATLFWLAGAGAVWAIVPAAFLFGITSGGVGTALWSAYADVIAHGAAGKEGLAYGVFTASAKLSLAISAAGIGLLLSDPTFREPANNHLLTGMTLPAVLVGLVTALFVGALRQRSRVDRSLA